jgi:type II secretory pathway component GspD/PulD (secretin)
MSGRIEIWDRLSYEREVLPTFAQTRVFDIREIYVDEAANVFKPLMTRTVGSITVVPSSRTVVVTDLPGKLELFADLLEQVDKVPAAEHSRGDSQTTTPR